MTKEIQPIIAAAAGARPRLASRPNPPRRRPWLRIEEGLPGWKTDEWRKQPERASLVPPRKTAEDDHDDEDDWGMTLNTYRCPAPARGMGEETGRI
jgi:hypothetical protein